MRVVFYRLNGAEDPVAEFDLHDVSRIQEGNEIAFASDPDVSWLIDKVEQVDGVLRVGLEYQGERLVL